jgi:hypothetical protein
MCCLVKAIAHLRRQWYMSVEQWWSEDSRGKPKKLRKKSPAPMPLLLPRCRPRLNLRLRIEKSTPKRLSYSSYSYMQMSDLYMYSGGIQFESQTVIVYHDRISHGFFQSSHMNAANIPWMGSWLLLYKSLSTHRSWQFSHFIRFYIYSEIERAPLNNVRCTHLLERLRSHKLQAL